MSARSRADGSGCSPRIIPVYRLPASMRVRFSNGAVALREAVRPEAETWGQTSERPRSCFNRRGGCAPCARDAPAPRGSRWRSVGLRGGGCRSARRSPRNSRSCRPRCASARQSIFEISLRSRSRVRSSIERSVSSEARSVRSGSDRLSSLRCCSVSVNFGQQLGPPPQQLLAEILELQRVHELFFLRWTIVWRKDWRASPTP